VDATTGQVDAILAAARTEMARRGALLSDDDLAALAKDILG
jgi:hypothetical protein